MDGIRRNTTELINNSTLIASIIVILYSAISPELFSLSTERVSHYQTINAISWPLNQAWPFITGLTSWTPIEDADNGVYFVEIVSYLPAMLARMVFKIDTVLKIQRLIDIAVIIGGISLFADLITKELIEVEKKTYEIALKTVIISSFIFSPWAAYLIYKSTWHEPLFMLVLISAMKALCCNKRVLGTLLLALSSLVHYQYMFFVSIYFLSSCILAIFNKQGKKVNWHLPYSIDLTLKKNYQKLVWSSIGLLAVPFHFLRKYIAAYLMELPPNGISGSSALSRIGIDGNVHSGGLIGSLQFLGGYKWYYCFSINNRGDRPINELDDGTISAIVNCGLIILTIVLVAAISLYGIALIYRFKDKSINYANLWMIDVVLFSFSGMLLIFQQSFTVHIVGYSYIWAFIFALGLSIIIYKNFILRGPTWKITGFFIYASCANSLIQASKNVIEIREISSFF